MNNLLSRSKSSYVLSGGGGGESVEKPPYESLYSMYIMDVGTGYIQDNATDRQDYEDGYGPYVVPSWQAFNENQFPYTFLFSSSIGIKSGYMTNLELLSNLRVEINGLDGNVIVFNDTLQCTSVGTDVEDGVTILYCDIQTTTFTISDYTDVYITVYYGEHEIMSNAVSFGIN